MDAGVAPTQVPGLDSLPLFDWLGLHAAAAWGWQIIPAVGRVPIRTYLSTSCRLVVLDDLEFEFLCLSLRAVPLRVYGVAERAGGWVWG